MGRAGTAGSNQILMSMVHATQDAKGPPRSCTTSRTIILHMDQPRRKQYKGDSRATHTHTFNSKQLYSHLVSLPPLCTQHAHFQAPYLSPRRDCLSLHLFFNGLALPFLPSLILGTAQVSVKAQWIKLSAASKEACAIVARVDIRRNGLYLGHVVSMECPRCWGGRGKSWVRCGWYYGMNTGHGNALLF